MSMFRTNNPALRPDVFTGWRETAGMELTAARPKTMTIQGTVNATFILLGICTACAVATWSWLAPALDAISSGEKVAMPAMAYPALIGASLGGLVLALIIGFVPKTAPYLSPVYSAVQGGFVGAISVVTAYTFPTGPTIVLQAGLLTFGILAGLLTAYCTRLIKPSENFKLGVAAATLGVAILFLGTFALRMFGVQVPYIFDNGPLGIAIAGFIVLLASANLVLDFDFIEEGAKAGAPKYMEWYGAFGLMATLIWLYLSLLRLLKLLASRE